MSKHPILTAEERDAHPGWAVRFSDGTWLCTSMVCERTDVHYASTYESSERAEEELKSAQKDEPAHFAGVTHEIVEAWQPLCETLRNRILFVRKACKLQPDEIDEAVFQLEDVLAVLKGKP